MKKIILASVLLLSVVFVSATNKNLKVKSFSNEIATLESVSPFCKLIQKGDYHAVKAFIENGADINLKSMGLTPLMFAARHNKSDIAELLIQHGAKLKTKSMKGYTALKYAEISGAKDSFKVIKKAIETQKSLKKRKRRQVI